MRTLSQTMSNRWAPIDGGARMATTASAATVVVASSATADTVTADVANGYATLTVANLITLAPAIGTVTLSTPDGMETTLERVGGRYCLPADIVAYGDTNQDDFGRFGDDAIAACIQQAEEAIDNGCGRSFTARMVSVTIQPGTMCELPCVDARSISEGGLLVSDRQAVLADGVVIATTCNVTYGAASDAVIHEACIRLAASYLRPRSGAENASGTAMDGVYVSYSLATGTDGSWTGIPYVDAAIETHRVHRLVVM